MASNLESVVSRLEAVATRLEEVAGHSVKASGEAAVDVAPFIHGYDNLVGGPLNTFVKHCNNLGGDVKIQCELLTSAFTAQQDVIFKASKAKQPSQDQLAKILEPLSAAIHKTQEFREKNRNSKQFNHLSAISESIPALGWVAVSPAPGPYVKEMSDAGQFYTNRVLKDFKEKEPVHTEWVKAWVETLNQLQAYIKQFHTTGLTWNPKGVDAGAVKATAAITPPPPPPAGGPPPPPPPPPMELGKSGGGDPRLALFSDLNKGTDITKGLKKVTNDQKTHKNPALKQGKPLIATKPSPKASPTPSQKSTSSSASQKPPRCELDGKKWIVENYHGNKNIQLNDTNIKQAVYIYNCVDSTLQIKGKVNSIVLDSCKKMGVVFDSVVSSLEFVNCKSVQGQVLGKAPTVSIDKTDGCMVYLSKDSVDAEIVTAKSSEMNILIPDKGGEFKEFPLPEQFKSRYQKGKVVTMPSESA